jgi:hypothetical protein
MYSVVLPRNPPLENFGQALGVFRTSRRAHHLIELNLVAGANFALGWIRKWHPRLNYSSMSLSLPPGRAMLRVSVKCFHFMQLSNLHWFDKCYGGEPMLVHYPNLD